MTRELSEGRRTTILAWLRDRNAYGERRLVHGRQQAPEAPIAAAVGESREAVGVGDDAGEIGGKSVAMPQALEALDRVRGNR